MLYILTIISSLIAYVSGNCCIAAPDESTCNDVSTTTCLWIEDDDAAMAISSNIPCVSSSWYECEVVGNCPPPPPVPPAPKDCIFDACANNQDVFNVAFLIDESGSVGYNNYMISLDFVENMIINDINNVSKIAMKGFASSVDTIYRFSDSQNDQKQGALAALTAERNNYASGSTCTGTALKAMADEFVANTNVHDNNILILMTDGHPNCGLTVCDQKAELDAAGVITYIAGVTNGFSQTKVECLIDDQNNLDDYIISIPRFDSKLFYHIEAQLRSVVCPANVFKDYTFFNNLFVSDKSIINGISAGNNPLLYTILILIFIGVGLVYYYREKICQKKEKYVVLNQRQSQYQSV